MAIINNVFQGIEIIRKYSNEAELKGNCFQAVDDQIYCGHYSGDKMTPQDLAKMKELGWFEHEDSWSMFA